MLLCLFSFSPSSCLTQGKSQGGFLHPGMKTRACQNLSWSPSKGSLWPGLAPSMERAAAEKPQRNILSWGGGSSVCAIDNFPKG